jgi:hypothetical protein
LPERFRGGCPFGATDLASRGELSRAAVQQRPDYSDRISDSVLHTHSVGDLPGWRRKSDLDDSDQTFKTLEVFTVPGYQRKVFSKSGRGNQQVCEPASGLASLVYHGGVYSAIRPSRSNVEWHRVKRGLGALQAILSSSAFGGIRRA